LISREVLEKIRRIEITTRSVVQEVFAGRYESIFKGRGMEFDEVREYQPGDDIRTIDWNVTARTGWLHVKKYIEERELTVVIAFDASGSFDFGTRVKLKREVAAEVGAILAFSAIRNNDKVGLLIFTDRIEGFIPPRKGRKHVLRILREILHFQPVSKGTNLGGALEYLLQVLKRRAVIFLISDFRDSDYEKALAVANRKHDVVAITITDPSEERMPPVGLVEVEDGETGEVVVLDLHNESSCNLFSHAATNLAKRRQEALALAKVDEIVLSTDRDYINPLIEFFQERARRQRWRY